MKEEGEGRTNLVVQSQIFSSWDSIETREIYLRILYKNKAYNTDKIKYELPSFSHKVDSITRLRIRRGIV